MAATAPKIGAADNFGMIFGYQLWSIRFWGECVKLLEFHEWLS